MRNEPDLYPPDIEVVTPDIRRSRNRAMAGTFLVTIGSGLMLERMFTEHLDYFWLAVGFALIAGWLQAPRFLMFAVGSIMTGFAFGSLVQSAIATPFESTIGLLCAATGFFAVYVRYPRAGKWAVVPAAITACFAVLATGVELIGFIPAALTSLGLPVLLIAGGALLLFRNALPSKVVKIGLILVVVSFITSAGSGIDKWDNGPEVGFTPPFGLKSVEAPLPAIEGRTVVLDADNADVLLTTSDSPFGRVTVRVQGRDAPIHFDTSDEEIDIELVGQHELFGPNSGRPQSWVLELPRGTDATVVTDRGAVRVEVEGGDVEIETDRGAVMATIPTGVETGTLTIETDRGSVQLDSDHPSLDLRVDSEDGDVRVDGESVDVPYSNDGAGPTVDIETNEGSVIVNVEAA